MTTIPLVFFFAPLPVVIGLLPLSFFFLPFVDVPVVVVVVVSLHSVFVAVVPRYENILLLSLIQVPKE